MQLDRGQAPCRLDWVPYHVNTARRSILPLKHRRRYLWYTCWVKPFSFSSSWEGCWNFGSEWGVQLRPPGSGAPSEGEALELLFKDRRNYQWLTRNKGTGFSSPELMWTLGGRGSRLPFRIQMAETGDPWSNCLEILAMSVILFWVWQKKKKKKLSFNE